MRKHWLLRGLQVALLAVVIWGVWSRLRPELGRLDAAALARWRPSALPLLASLVAVVVVYLVHAFLWRRIVADITGRTPPPGSVIRVYFVSSLGRYIPGKVWQVAGLALLAQREGVSALGATAASIIGQIGFLTTGCLFLAATLPSWSGSGVAAAAAVAVLVVGAVGLGFLTATPAGARLRHALAARAPTRVAPAIEALDRVRPGVAALWALGYAASWVLLGAAFTLFVTAFAPASLAHVRYLSGAVAASYLAGYIAIVAPAGIGVREAAMVALLAAVIPGPAALVVSIVSRLWFTAAELLPLAALPWLRPRHPGAKGTATLEVL